MIVVAVDVGLTGAIAWLDSAGNYGVADMPTIELPGTGLVRRKVDARALILLMRDFCRPNEPVTAVCEQVQTMGGKNNALQTQGSLMRSLGAIEAVFEVMRLTPTLISPIKWKNYYKLEKAKHASLEVARKLFPKADLKLAKRHNRAEALLIAHYAMQKMT